MEFTLSRLDQIQTTLFNFLPSKSLCDFSLKFKTPLPLIKCSSSSLNHQQKLQPRPKPKPNQIPHTPNSTSDICSNIEKLVRFKRYSDAFVLFDILESKTDCDNIVTASTHDALITACIESKSIRNVKRLYNYMLKYGYDQNLYMNNRILLMHVKCRMMLDAKRLFDEMPERDLVSWSTILVGLVDAGDFEVAFDLFGIMWGEFDDPGPHSFVTMIRASKGLGCGDIGRQLHCNVLKLGFDENIFIACGLIDMYGKCGDLEDAQYLFDELPEKSLVGWNTIIAGYALHGYSEQALKMYYKMHDSGVKMDCFTYSTIIGVCARLASVGHAKQVHARLVRDGLGKDLETNTALVDFYGKWGKIEDAHHVFDGMPVKNLKSWNAIVAAYKNHGKGVEAVGMFQRLIDEGLAPDHVTFLAVLSACANSGLSDKGWEIFESMHRVYKVKPRAMHYACMIQLLGREGLLDEALALIRDAPFRPTENMWGALLNACRIHKNFELAKLAAERLYGMKAEKINNYVVLYNIYNSSGRSEEAAAVEQTLRRRGLRMLPACSWIEIKKQSYCFHSEDRSHPQTKVICEKLNKLMQEIEKLGYVPADKSWLPDVDKKEEQISFYHSEKLAIAFGLISTPDSTPLQVVQSHRICSDCHNVIKLISMSASREIVLRDATRFHHFKDGICSCGDYW